MPVPDNSPLELVLAYRYCLRRECMARLGILMVFMVVECHANDNPDIYLETPVDLPIPVGGGNRSMFMIAWLREMQCRREN